MAIVNVPDFFTAVNEEQGDIPIPVVQRHALAPRILGDCHLLTGQDELAEYFAMQPTNVAAYPRHGAIGPFIGTCWKPAGHRPRLHWDLPNSILAWPSLASHRIAIMAGNLSQETDGLIGTSLPGVCWSASDALLLP